MNNEETMDPKLWHPMLPNAFTVPDEGPRPQHVNRASGICHPCMYHSYLARTQWQERKPWSPTFLQIFQLGKEIERRTIAGLLKKGMEVQRLQETLQWPDLQMTGHLDFLVEVDEVVKTMDSDGLWVPDEHRINGSDLVAVDVKSADPAVFGQYRSIEDLLAPLTGVSAYRWLYPGQLSLYAIKVGAKWCCIYFVNRSTNQVVQVWWPIDHPLAQQEVENAYNACRWINRAIAMPDRDVQEIADELARPGRWCEACAFGHTCERYLLTGDYVHVNAELADLVGRRLESAGAKRTSSKAYDEANNRLKAIWKKRHEEHGDHEVLCGDVMVKIKKAKNGSIRPTYRPKKR